MIAKVLIVDDHPAVREGLAVRIASHPDLEVCGQAADAAEAMSLVAAVHPDLVVLDIQLKTSNGLDLIGRIKALNPSIRILVWSMYADALYAQRPCTPGPWGTSTRNTPPGGLWRPFAAFAMARYTFAKRSPSSCWARRPKGPNSRKRWEWSPSRTMSWRSFGSSVRGFRLLKLLGASTAARTPWKLTGKRSNVS